MQIAQHADNGALRVKVLEWGPNKEHYFCPNDLDSYDLVITSFQQFSVRKFPFGSTSPFLMVLLLQLRSTSPYYLSIALLKGLRWREVVGLDNNAYDVFYENHIEMYVGHIGSD